MSDIDETKAVFSEPSHGSYVTSDDEVALPNYLVHLLSQNYIIVDIDVEEELNERVNVDNLDDDRDNERNFDDSIRGVEL